MTAIHAVGN